MALVIITEINGRPFSEAYESVGEVLKRARTLSATSQNVQIRDSSGKRYTPDDFARSLQGAAIR
ncbi:hypothetical protein [Methylobacterium planeticum]|uniref:Uncharacterized protein n=1 Tax=Methylobacterium planeticum TaxID=2615211 RepID=A0A6N6MPM8_9HYPH|nr:hypothetical protein [Methylobacterium planeticum]KAB1073344.1 hypothetical protein F6X51_11325 [Methylobacterium planeticum]